MEAQRIPVTGGVTLNVLTWPEDGGEAPVLLVHGLSSNARLWEAVADRLSAAGHPVAAVDQRGHGRSDKPDGGYDFETLIADLAAVVTTLGWDPMRPPIVAGQSWGANVVLELAAVRADLVAALVLVDGGTIELSARFADWPTCEAALAPPPLSGTSAATFERFLRMSHPEWPESGITATLANVEVLPDGTIRPWLSPSHHMTILRHLWEHHPSSRYGVIAAPVLLVPAEDPANPRWMAQKRDEVDKATAALDLSVTRWIAGDHDLHAQHPDLIAELIEAASRPGLFPA